MLTVIPLWRGILWRVVSQDCNASSLRQRRLGVNGKCFDLIKLRSMKLDDETAGVGLTIKDDPRCLKAGAFMRRMNIDEIPQYNARHSIKPGITGWARANGLYDDTDLS